MRLFVLATVVVLAGCGGSSADDDPDVITVYSGRAAALIGGLVDRYEAAEDVDLKIRFGETAELAATLREEGDKSPADLFFAQDAGSLGALQDAGLLAPLPRDVLDKVDARYRSAGGVWVGTSARARIIAYNRERLKPADLPRSVLGLTDATWKGRVGWAPTNASFQAFVTALRKLEGEDGARRWLEGMKANGAVAFPNNVAIRDAVARGELDVGLINHYYVAEAIAEEGADYPVGLYFPPGGDPGALVNVAGVGLVRGSEKREQVLKFIRYLLSQTGQRYFADKLKEYPVVAGVAADRSLPALASIRQPDIDLTALDDLQGTLDLLRETGVL